MIEKLQILKNYKYSIEEDSSSIYISRKNIKGILGIVIIAFGVLSLISSFTYLALNDQTSFNPTLLNSLIAFGVMSSLIGFGVRNGRNSIKVTINQSNISIWKKDSDGIHQISLPDSLALNPFIDQTNSDMCYVSLSINDKKKIEIFELKRTTPKKEVEIVKEITVILNKTIG